LADHPLLADTPPEPGSPWAFKWDINWPVWLDHEGIRQLVTGLVLHSPDRYTTAVVLDGVAAGFAHHGLHLRTPRDLSLCAGPGLTTLPVTADMVDRIQARVTSPQHAAALVLTLITEVWASVLTGLTIGGVSHDEATVTLPPHTPAQIQRYGLSVGASQSIDPSYRVEPVTFGVPTPARPLLAAARYLALLHGGALTDLLLHDPRRPRMERIDATTVGVLADRCGVSLPPRLHPMSIPWTARLGCTWRSGCSRGHVRSAPGRPAIQSGGSSCGSADPPAKPSARRTGLTELVGMR
jgi:hypothetical protein